MAILADSRILREMKRGNIIIDPFFRECLGSNSYDVHLGPNLLVYTEDVIDAKKDNPTSILEIPEEGFVMEPGKLYLASTIEYTETYRHVPFLEGKSSMGRLGVSIHETAGKGDEGFRGHWTLEMKVDNPGVRVYAGMPIGQLLYHELNGKVLNPYDKKVSAKYSNQGAMPVESRMWKNFGKDPLWK